MTDELNEETGVLPEASCRAVTMPPPTTSRCRQHLRAAIAADWDPAPPMPHPARPDVAPYAAQAPRPRCPRHFAGQRWSSCRPAHLKVRANDTDYAFRAASRSPG